MDKKRKATKRATQEDPIWIESSDEAIGFKTISRYQTTVRLELIVRGGRVIALTDLWLSDVMDGCLHTMILPLYDAIEDSSQTHFASPRRVPVEQVVTRPIRSTLREIASRTSSASVQSLARRSKMIIQGREHREETKRWLDAKGFVATRHPVDEDTAPHLEPPFQSESTASDSLFNHPLRELPEVSGEVASSSQSGSTELQEKLSSTTDPPCNSGSDTENILGWHGSIVDGLETDLVPEAMHLERPYVVLQCRFEPGLSWVEGKQSTEDYEVVDSNQRHGNADDSANIQSDKMLSGNRLTRSLEWAKDEAIEWSKKSRLWRRSQTHHLPEVAVEQ
ncbi:hypothetical protein M427DRAFT_222804 [Gonapodya prolifera JEL478]|uniref:Uncharacterized protein n=1 Tax=Gonapodya prolifera (strain JEL478) TaxID=1344416 RepID=A0A139AN22_GONPJ|nr:hypothetical protein M427DRAFT_222804 [Gonapodya prolifera JEL478]|eukprot:KXS18136.1 hypothetical protein M427DRAFT_222804 [Gonapodya prolifera JEL478]